MLTIFYHLVNETGIPFKLQFWSNPNVLANYVTLEINYSRV